MPVWPVLGAILAAGLALDTAAVMAAPDPNRARPPSLGEVRRQSIAALEVRLAAFPRDVDSRLRLAHLLAWDKQLIRAREQTEAVIKQTPKYWDAHLLLARIDAWAGRFEPARKRVTALLPTLPDVLPAHRLLLDIAMWSKDQAGARRQIAWLLERDQRPELYVQLAVVEQRAMNNIAVLRAANRALELDPTNEAARRLRQDARLASFDLAYEFEWYGFAAAGLPGHATLLTATVLPRNFLALTIVEEYRYRFESHNNRLSLQLDWRISPKILLTTRGGFALPNKVLPKMTLGSEVLFPIGALGSTQNSRHTGLARFDGLVGYTVDLPPWGGHLHRLLLQGGVDLPYGFRVEARYVVGILARSCRVDDLHGARLRGYFTYRDFSASLDYGFGMELDRPPISGEQIVGGDPGIDYDSAGCPIGGSGEPVPLSELFAHSVGTQLSYRITPQISVRGGYNVQVRLDPNNTPVHVTTLGARAWF